MEHVVQKFARCSMVSVVVVSFVARVVNSAWATWHWQLRHLLVFVVVSIVTSRPRCFLRDFFVADPFWL